MEITIYNTLTRQKEVFKSLEANQLKMYTCGPTVYNYVHIGNARMSVFFDVVRRFFTYRGYDVTYVQNLTDVDDRIIHAAREHDIPEKELSEKFAAAYNEDLNALNVLSPTVQPKVTDHIPHIIHFITRLIEKGLAYVVKGDVYYRVETFDEYGKLSNQPLLSLKHTERDIAFVVDYKENEFDFVLWKAQKENEIAWDSPWGMGRPGWHIECSAMSINYLGETFDLHGGGLDLIYPHHEHEIVQSEGLTGKPFANYWMHNNYVTVDGQKMSKSLGNFTTVHDALQSFDGNTIRMFFLSKNYSTEIDYSETAMHQAKVEFEKIENVLSHLQHLEVTAKHDEVRSEFQEKLMSAKDEILQLMSDDFNTADTIKVILGVIKFIYQTDELSGREANFASNILIEISDMLGFSLQSREKTLDEKWLDLIKQRDELKEKAKHEKEKVAKISLYKQADEIRETLSKNDIFLEDTPHGTKWKLKK